MCRILTLEQTCEFCPSQWEGELSNGKIIYIRYRFGIFSYGVGEILSEAIGDQKAIYNSDDEWDGFMSTSDMLKRLPFDFEGI